MPPDRNSLLLAGNVRVTGSGQAAASQAAASQAVILTDQLAYDTRRQHHADGRARRDPVRHARTAGPRLRVVLNDGTLRLESNVNGRFKP